MLPVTSDQEEEKDIYMIQKHDNHGNSKH